MNKSKFKIFKIKLFIKKSSHGFKNKLDSYFKKNKIYCKVLKSVINP